MPPEIEATTNTRTASLRNCCRVVALDAAIALGFERLRHGAANPLARLPGMIGKRQPAQRSQTFGAQRAGNVVEPAAAQPMQKLLRVIAIMLRAVAAADSMFRRATSPLVSPAGCPASARGSVSSSRNCTAGNSLRRPNWS